MHNPQNLEQAIQLHQQGSFDIARGLYQQVLANDPSNAAAHHFFGLLEHQTGNFPSAMEHLQTSIRIQPNEAFYFVNLGILFKDLHKGEEAENAYKRSLALNPAQPVAHYNLGHLYQLMGRKEEAIKALAVAANMQPDLAVAVNKLGQMLMEKGDLEEAIRHLETAIRAEPSLGEAHFHLGDCYGRKQNWARSRDALERAIALSPRFAEAHNNLGLARKELGLLREAREAFLEASAISHDFCDPYNNLGQMALDTHRMDEAHHWFQKALAIEPANAQTHLCMGNYFNIMGQPEAAMNWLSKAIELRPGFHQALNNLGNILLGLKRNKESITMFESAIKHKPDFHEAHANLGNSYKEMGFPDLAESTLLEAIRLKPDFAAAHSNLGNAYFDQGKMEAAIASYKKGIDLGQTDRDFVPNYLFALNYSTNLDERQICEEHKRLAQQYFDPNTDLASPWPNVPDHERKLRIGYVSPDFWMHPVARFMIPLLENHNREEVEVFAYSSRFLKDPISFECHKRVDQWREVYSLTTEELNQLIRDDKIDILVDLTMHSRDCKPWLFALKPAPIQVSYLAYAGTTGLKAMDYRLTDIYLDPPEKEDYAFTEKPLRLPVCWWNFQLPPGVPLPEVQAPPSVKNGYVTFGSLNNFAKVNIFARETWAAILAGVPGSQLLLHIKHTRTREDVLNFFEERGVSKDRITLIGYQDGPNYIKTYHQIDIALDPFPFAGGTTTFDSLWMGVPVVTLAGDRAVGRGGLSILSTLGRKEWVGFTREEYIQIAIRLATERGKLPEIRENLRKEIAASPLMDSPRFAREVEKHFRAIWREWCEGLKNKKSGE